MQNENLENDLSKFKVTHTYEQSKYDDTFVLSPCSFVEGRRYKYIVKRNNTFLNKLRSVIRHPADSIMEDPS